MIDEGTRGKQVITQFEPKLLIPRVEPTTYLEVYLKKKINLEIGGLEKHVHIKPKHFEPVFCFAGLVNDTIHVSMRAMDSLQKEIPRDTMKTCYLCISSQGKQ